MYTLGISCYYHDSAASLLKDGKVLAAVEEERFSRKKFDDSFPKMAIDWCLKEAGISPENIDSVAFYDKPVLKFERLLDNYIAVAPRGLYSFLDVIPKWLHKRLWVKDEISKHLKDFNGEIIFPEHLIDIKRALHWIKKNNGEYGVDPDFVVATGGTVDVLIVAGGGAAWCTCSEGTDDADAVLTEGDGVGGGTGCGSGGGGFYGNGTTSLQGYGTGGLAFVNGGTGGDGDFFQNIYISEGGFGSGGGASNCCIGGGGGYTGGKGAAACGAKGGHSYFNPEGSSRTDIGTDNTGHGKVIITFIE